MVMELVFAKLDGKARNVISANLIFLDQLVLLVHVMLQLLLTVMIQDQEMDRVIVQ